MNTREIIQRIDKLEDWDKSSFLSRLEVESPLSYKQIIGDTLKGNEEDVEEAVGKATELSQEQVFFATQLLEELMGLAETLANDKKLSQKALKSMKNCIEDSLFEPAYHL